MLTKYDILRLLIGDAYMNFVANASPAIDADKEASIHVVEMLKDGLIAMSTHKGAVRYWITWKGREFYADMRANPNIRVGNELRAWREEVLTGMDRRGKQTEIEQAALNSNKTKI